ncbi:MAG: ornithine carbamoyltransferase [Deltaproteobacteria bacterium]|nr:ornithine carbamoyltransferase [Deltaproteobacteria bacterium]
MSPDLLTLFDLNSQELQDLLVRARELKALKAQGRLPQPLAGQVWALLFEKASTRTRVSFQVGMAALGGTSLFLTPDQTQLGRGEPLEDTARVLDAYLDGLVVRSYAHETIEIMAKWTRIPVINGLSERCHPCQILADMMTILERRGSFDGLKAAWVGDGNNVANSWIAAAARLGFELTLACPEGYDPDPLWLAQAENLKALVKVVRDPYAAVAGAEVISTDVWAGMGQEAEASERSRAFAAFQVNAELLTTAKNQAFVLHCLPAHRGEEITDEVLEGPQSAVFAQAENRLYAQMAVLEALSSRR